MSKKNIGVLHIDSEFGWRGGQQQVIYLLEQMIILHSALWETGLKRIKYWH